MHTTPTGGASVCSRPDGSDTNDQPASQPGAPFRPPHNPHNTLGGALAVLLPCAVTRNKQNCRSSPQDTRTCTSHCGRARAAARQHTHTTHLRGRYRCAAAAAAAAHVHVEESSLCVAVLCLARHDSSGVLQRMHTMPTNHNQGRVRSIEENADNVHTCSRLLWVSADGLALRRGGGCERGREKKVLPKTH